MYAWIEATKPSGALACWTLQTQPKGLLYQRRLEGMCVGTDGRNETQWCCDMLNGPAQLQGVLGGEKSIWSVSGVSWKAAHQKLTLFGNKLYIDRDKLTPDQRRHTTLAWIEGNTTSTTWPFLLQSYNAT